jgi:hypothetical protein
MPFLPGDHVTLLHPVGERDILGWYEFEPGDELVVHRTLTNGLVRLVHPDTIASGDSWDVRPSYLSLASVSRTDAGSGMPPRAPESDYAEPAEEYVGLRYAEPPTPKPQKAVKKSSVKKTKEKPVRAIRSRFDLILDEPVEYDTTLICKCGKTVILLESNTSIESHSKASIVCEDCDAKVAIPETFKGPRGVKSGRVYLSGYLCGNLTIRSSP